jgi:cytochrome d ubiquinol oxidase subunit I
MFGVTALDLARVQFAFTMSFHILFPAITIGLASYLAVLELCWLRTRRQVFVDLYHFWLKIFAVAFGMGVVSGIVMAYQFGTNWSFFSEYAGPITGPLLAYEVLTAFFLEARWGPACTSSPPAWLRSARSSRPPGSSAPTVGCRRPRATPS